LSRFDGYSFTTYGVAQGLRNPIVNDLLETREGQYWVATGEGLYRFDPLGIAQRSSISDVQASSAVKPMFTVSYPGEDSSSNSVLTLFEDSKGVIWCGTEKGLYRLEHQNGPPTFRYVDIGIDDEDKSPGLINAIIEDRHGALWIGSATGVYQLLPDGRAQHYNHERNGLPFDYVHSLLEDRDGRL